MSLVVDQKLSIQIQVLGYKAVEGKMYWLFLCSEYVSSDLALYL